MEKIMTINLQTLKTELLTDPNSYGYAALIADTNNPALAAMLNLPRAGIQMPRPDVTPLEILEAINVDDFVATANQSILVGSWFESLTQFPQIRVLKDNGTDARVMTNIMKILKNGTSSETRVRALAVRNGSCIEQLFGVGVIVSVQEVIDAQRI
jgi:hypothetical protein